MKRIHANAQRDISRNGDESNGIPRARVRKLKFAIREFNLDRSRREASLSEAHAKKEKKRGKKEKVRKEREAVLFFFFFREYLA